MRLRRTIQDTPEELADTASLLEAQRPRATEMELDRVKRSVLARSRRTPTTGGFMRTRLALTSILALGLLMSMGGGALALSGLTGSQSAGDAVYPTTPGGDVEGNTGSGGSGSNGSNGSSGSGSDTLGDPGSNAGTPDAALQPAAQTESNSDGKLPFTGYAAIPLVLIGIALLATGLVMRRRTSSPRLN